MDELVITGEECRKVVQTALKCHAPDSVVIVSHTVQVAGGPALGFLGEYFRLLVEAKIKVSINLSLQMTDDTDALSFKDCPASSYSFFLKSIPRRNRETQIIVRNLGLFRKEAELYQLFKKMECPAVKIDNAWHPEYYLARDDVIVLQDLAATYRHIDDRRQMNGHEVSELLKCLGRMHASSLAFEKRSSNREPLSSSRCYGEFLRDTTLDPANEWFGCGLRMICFVAYNYCDTSRLPVEQTEFMDRLNQVYCFSEEVTAFERVICHRDVWYKNCMFKYPAHSDRPEHCLLLDFQKCCYQPPAADVLQAILVNSRRAVRDHELDKWLRFYLDFLRRHLRTEYTFSETELFDLKFLNWTNFCETVDHYRLLALVSNCVITSVVQLAPGLLDDLQRESPHDYHYVSIVDRSQFVHEQMERDAHYRDHLMETVEELLAFLFN